MMEAAASIRGGCCDPTGAVYARLPFGLMFGDWFVGVVERRLFLASISVFRGLLTVLPFLGSGDFPDGELSC